MAKKAKPKTTSEELRFAVEQVGKDSELTPSDFLKILNKERGENGKEPISSKHAEHYTTFAKVFLSFENIFEKNDFEQFGKKLCGTGFNLQGSWYDIQCFNPKHEAYGDVANVVKEALDNKQMGRERLCAYINERLKELRMKYSDDSDLIQKEKKNAEHNWVRDNYAVKFLYDRSCVLVMTEVRLTKDDGDIIYDAVGWTRSGRFIGVDVKIDMSDYNTITKKGKSTQEKKYECYKKYCDEFFVLTCNADIFKQWRELCEGDLLSTQKGYGGVYIGNAENQNAFFINNSNSDSNINFQDSDNEDNYQQMLYAFQEKLLTYITTVQLTNVDTPEAFIDRINQSLIKKTDKT